VDERQANDADTLPAVPPAPDGPTSAALHPADPPSPSSRSLLTPADALDPFEAAEEREDRAALQRSARFRVEALVGAGGMGRVYKVFDQSLQRYAALKVLRLPGAQSVLRFLHEAKAQARVDHPNVCTVYEAGELEGRYFIAMQLIDGHPLSLFGRGVPAASAPALLSLEEMVGVFRQVAEGIHAAHRLGLVHRDVKPSNVLLARSEEEGWRPYVVDFGIARELSGPQVTATGALIGTPAFMAPEQVRGSGVDRRTDVYGLGVTMYQVLSGQLPIGTTSSLEALAHVLADEARPLREARPDVPADLEAIVMKCLEKDPGARYDSARALAEDLSRFLDGEPVGARTITWRYRLARKLRKNRTLVAVSTAAAAALLALGVVAVRERWLAGEMARQAQRFGRQAEQMEWLLRVAHELPLHDTTHARRLVRSQLESLEAQLPGLGRGARGPAAYALGRGYLALDEDDQADGRLEAAWQAGYRGPEVAYARGLVLVRGYQRALERARGLRDADERRAAVEEARRRFRAPAMDFLTRSAPAATAAPEYLSALVSFLEGGAEAALEKARAAVDRLPWLYEARLLEAELRREEADRAADPAARERALAAAEAALQDAIRRGESDPRAYADLCGLAVDRMARGLHGSGEGVAAQFQTALTACGQALVADPTHLRARALEVSALTAMAGWELDRGGDPAPRLAEAERVARAAVGGHPTRPEAHRALAAVWQHQARARRSLGGDVPDALRAAIASLQQSLAHGAADWRTLQELGNAKASLAVQEKERGADPSALLAASQRDLEQAVALAPQLYSPHFNLGRTLGDAADHELQRGGDPRPQLEAAAAAYRRAIELKPDYPQAHNSLGVVLLSRGWAAPRFKSDARPYLEEAVRHLERAIAIQASYANPRFNLGLVHRTLAGVDAGAGRDPWPELERAAASFKAGLAINPNVFFAYLEMGRVYVNGAEWEVEHGRSPEKALAEARRLVNRSLSAVPDDYMGLLVLGEAVLAEARWELGRGRDPAALLERARTTLERARASNPEEAQTYAALAQLELLAAERALARRQPTEAALAAGHQQVAASLQRNPTASAPQVTAGKLWLVAARQAPQAEARRAAAAKAQAALASALQADAGIERGLAGTAAEAARLAR
jgi:eukaryotic-like serine/threonine-protein kinase